MLQGQLYCRYCKKWYKLVCERIGATQNHITKKNLGCSPVYRMGPRGHPFQASLCGLDIAVLAGLLGLVGCREIIGNKFSNLLWGSAC